MSKGGGWQGKKGEEKLGSKKSREVVINDEVVSRVEREETKV
jgi:hypothetical protein